MEIKRYFLILIFLIFSNLQIFTQISGLENSIKGNKNIFSLSECIELAINNNLDIKIADTRMAASEADVTSAFGQFLPSITVNSGYTRQLNAKPGYEFYKGSLVPTDPKANSYNLSAGASLLIFDGFSRASNYNRAHESYTVTELNSKFIRERIKLQVYQYYTDVIAKAQIVKIRRENLELGRKELDRIEAQKNAGLISIDVVYSQQADLGNKEYELVSAENSLNSAKANLLILMGMKPNLNSEFLESSLPADIDSNTINEFRNSIGTLSNIQKQVFQSRHDYVLTEAQIRAYEANLEGSKAGYYPTISASGGWSWSYIELDKFSEMGRSSIGFNINIPIFDQFTTNYRIQTAQVQLEQSKLEKEQLEQNIISSLQNAFLNLEASEKQLEISSRALKAAQRNSESQQEKFRIGTASITEYLTANTQLITSQINRINAVYQYFRAQKELLFVIGKLD